MRPREEKWPALCHTALGDRSKTPTPWVQIFSYWTWLQRIDRQWGQHSSLLWVCLCRVVWSHSCATLWMSPPLRLGKYQHSDRVGLSLPAAGVTCLVSPDWVWWARGKQASESVTLVLLWSWPLTETRKEGLFWFTFPEGVAFTVVGASSSILTAQLMRRWGSRELRATACKTYLYWLLLPARPNLKAPQPPKILAPVGEQVRLWGQLTQRMEAEVCGLLWPNFSNYMAPCRPIT